MDSQKKNFLHEICNRELQLLEHEYESKKDKMSQSYLEWIEERKRILQDIEKELR